MTAASDCSVKNKRSQEASDRERKEIVSARSERHQQRTTTAYTYSTDLNRYRSIHVSDAQYKWVVRWQSLPIYCGEYGSNKQT